MNSKSATKASQEESQKLSALIAEAKCAKTATKFKQLDRYRDVLLKERDKASVREITVAVTKLGMDVSEETVRLWFKRNAATPMTMSLAPRPIKRVSASDSQGYRPGGRARPRAPCGSRQHLRLPL
jgi:hypothetical protein